MSMVAIALLLAEAAAPAPKRLVTTQAVGKTVEFPDQIAPAIIPYLVCIQTQYGQAQKRIEARQKSLGLSPEQTKQANDPAVEGCSNTRTKARSEGITLAKSISGASYEERIRLVDDALTNVEGMNDLVFLGTPTFYDPPKLEPFPLDKMKPGTLYNGGVVVPNAISDHFERYTRCLVGETTGPSRIMPYDPRIRAGKVEAAIKACASLRQAELAQAKAILRKSSDFTTPAEADAAADATFASAEDQQRQLPQIFEKISQETLSKDKP